VCAQLVLADCQGVGGITKSAVVNFVAWISQRPAQRHLQSPDNACARPREISSVKVVQKKYTCTNSQAGHVQGAA
jgi:hypothetical protein